MDSLTHALFGTAMAGAGLSRRFGPGAAAAVVLGSIAPDVDFFWGLATGTPHFACRRMLTHSLFGGPALMAGLAYLLRMRYTSQSWARLWGLALLGFAGHVLLDLVNSFGVVLFYPFSRGRFELSWMFILDFSFSGILLAPAVAWALRRWRDFVEPVSRWSLAGALLYMALCGAFHARAMSLLLTQADRRGGMASLACAFPEPFGPHRFRGVTRIGDSYRIYLIHVLTGRVEPRGGARTDEGNPRVRAAMNTPMGRDLLWFFKAPVFQEDPATGEVVAWDLRFKPLVVERKETPFEYRLGIPGTVY